jgi:type VI protein secretion system component VasK
MKLNNLLKYIVVAGLLLTVPGCKPKPNAPPLVDQVMFGLTLADQVDQQLIPIVRDVNPDVVAVLGKVDTDLQLVVKVYGQYDTAAGATPTNADLLRATVGSIQQNLAAILDAIGVKNPGLITTVRVGVLIMNTALVAVLDRLPAPPQVITQAATVNGIGVIPNATVAQLKQQWNQQVAGPYPSAVIK